MALQEQTVETMVLFIEKANKLTTSRFVQYINDNTKGIQVSWKRGGKPSVDWDAPDGEAVDALVLTLRFFIQANERTSLRSMQNILSDPAISQYWRGRYEKVRDQLNEFLDSSPRQMQVGNGGPAFTRRETMEIFVYGGLAHANQQKRRIFEELKKDPFRFPMFEYNFVDTLNEIVNAVGYLAGICDRELKGKHNVT